MYELCNTGFMKYAGDLLDVNNIEDIINFHKHLQSMTIQQNIFVTNFEYPQYWDKNAEPLPTLCLFAQINSYDNTELAYKRIYSVLHWNISKAKFHQKEQRNNPQPCSCSGWVWIPL